MKSLLVEEIQIFFYKSAESVTHDELPFQVYTAES
jgi:hypothetical protein